MNWHATFPCMAIRLSTLLRGGMNRSMLTRLFLLSFSVVSVESVSFYSYPTISDGSSTVVKFVEDFYNYTEALNLIIIADSKRGYSEMKSIVKKIWLPASMIMIETFESNQTVDTINSLVTAASKAFGRQLVLVITDEFNNAMEMFTKMNVIQGIRNCWLLIQDKTSPEINKELTNDKFSNHRNQIFVAVVRNLFGLVFIDVRYPCEKRNRDQLQLHSLGIWNSKMGLNARFEFKDCCENFRGTTVNIVTVCCHMPVNDIITSGDKIKMIGIFPDVIRIILGYLEMNYTVYKVPDDQYGYYDPETGESTGMIHELVTKKADIAIGSWSLTENRSKVVEYSPPLLQTSATAVYKLEANYMSNLHISPFHTHSWILILVGVPLIVLISLLIYRLQASESEGKEVDFTILFGAIINQGAEINFRTPISKIIYFTLLMFGLLIVNFYTSKVTSDRAVSKGTAPFKDFSELSSSRDYRPLFVNGTSHYNEVMNPPNKDYARLKERMLTDLKFHTVHSASVARSMIYDGGIAYISDKIEVEYEKNKDRTLRLMEAEYFVSGLYILWQKDSKFGLEFSRQLLKLRESGIVHRIFESHSKVKNFGPNSDAEVTIEMCSVPFMILSAALILSFVMLGLSRSRMHHD